MKRAIIILIVAALMLSLAACGSGGSSKDLKVGEMTKTDSVEFVLDSWEFTNDKVDGSSVSDGHTFVYLHFSVKNVGKANISYSPFMKVIYDNHYEFNINPVSTYHCKINNKWGNYGNTSFPLEPLSEAREYRGVIEVPLEVKENTDKSLKLKVLPDRGSDLITYILR